MVTFQIVPYADVEDLSSVGRIRKLLSIAKSNRIAILQGQLDKDEETELIKATMEEINKEFKGIELAVINSAKGKGLMGSFASMLLGNRDGLTIIGPANIVKKIKKNPNKIELITKERHAS